MRQPLPCRRRRLLRQRPDPLELNRARRPAPRHRLRLSMPRRRLPRQRYLPVALHAHVEWPAVGRVVHQGYHRRQFLQRELGVQHLQHVHREPGRAPHDSFDGPWVQGDPRHGSHEEARDEVPVVLLYLRARAVGVRVHADLGLRDGYGERRRA